MSTAPGVCALRWVKCREHISLLLILCIVVYVTNNLINNNNNNNNISALGVLKGYLTKKCNFCHDLPSSYKPVCLYCISIVSRFG